MRGVLVGIGGALFRLLARITEPRQILIHTSRGVACVRLSRTLQVFAALVLSAFAATTYHVTDYYVRNDEILAQKDQHIAWLTQRGLALSARVTSMNDDVSIAAGTLERTHNSLVGLMAQNDTLRDEISQLRDQLQSSDGRRAQQIRRQAALYGRLSQLETKLDSEAETRSRLARELDDTKSRLNNVLVERSEIATSRNSMQTRLESLERRMEKVRDSQANALSRVADSAMRDIKRLRGMILKTGLDPDELLRKLDPESYGTGGPFVPVAADTGAQTTPEADLAALDRYLEHWEDMQTLVHRLPFISPVLHGRLSSGFGRRRDPMNGRWAVHDGIDLSAHSRTPVLAPAPGKVVHTGWKGSYGRFVEIDHGNGIRTRYGHLRRINVKRGQMVEFGQKIGQVGSSGRSTGPHVHYEILVNGKRVDPEKFIQAGKDVFKG